MSRTDWLGASVDDINSFHAPRRVGRPHVFTLNPLSLATVRVCVHRRTLMSVGVLSPLLSPVYDVVEGYREA